LEPSRGGEVECAAYDDDGVDRASISLMDVHRARAFESCAAARPATENGCSPPVGRDAAPYTAPRSGASGTVPSVHPLAPAVRPRRLASGCSGRWLRGDARVPKRFGVGGGEAGVLWLSESNRQLVPPFSPNRDSGTAEPASVVNTASSPWSFTAAASAFG